MHNVTIRATEVEKSFAGTASFGSEVAALEQLRKYANDQPLSDGWRVRVPALLAVDESTATVVMERAGGATLLRLLQSAELVPWRQIGEAIGSYHAKAMQHGDLTVSNVIIDREHRDIWLIDPTPLSSGNVWSDLLMLLWALFHRSLNNGVGIRPAVAMLAGWGTTSGGSIRSVEAYGKWPRVRARLLHGHSVRQVPRILRVCSYWAFRHLWLPAVLAAASRSQD